MNNRLKPIIESLIFVSLEPISSENLKEILSDVPKEEIEIAIKSLMEDYNNGEKGIQITRAAGGYIFSTNPEYDPYIRKMLNLDRKNRLSPASLEALTTIAYHQPITLSEISAMRGVDSSHSVKTLLKKKLIKITGRKKSPGKPLIYRTTDQFLTYFSLDSIDDLPSEEEISKLLEEENDED